ncbi:hypothetical protein [Zooshikella ganghwensis]|uniref:hypothetical protein n=1 Tax=Zooshikella ganghwensis TaxID=202772 RepID=UPI00048744E5|nr:hypothetical protein [Zooshikella ganghwensis]
MKYFYIFSLLLLPLASIAQESSIKSTMNEYGKALKVYDTKRMADLMHPDALKRFKKVIQNALTSERSEKAKKDLLPMFAVESIQDFEKLSEKEVFRRSSEFIVYLKPEYIELFKSSTITFVDESYSGNRGFAVYNIGINFNGKVIKQHVVQQMKRHDDKWFLLLPEEAEASIAAIENRY